VAVYVAPPFGVEVAEDRPKLPGVNARVEVGDHPALYSPNPVQALIV